MEKNHVFEACLGTLESASDGSGRICATGEIWIARFWTFSERGLRTRKISVPGKPALGRVANTRLVRVQGFFEMLGIAVFNSTELKGFVKPTFGFRERRFYERNGGPSKCSWWRRAGKPSQNVKVMMQD